LVDDWKLALFGLV
jgi:hypothetical protein